MLFTSLTYLAFLLCAVVATRLTQGVWRERVLLGASFVFYAAWDVRFLAVLLSLGVGTYFVGQRLARLDRKAEQARRRTLVTWAIVGVLLILATFKYTGWLVELTNRLLPAGKSLPVPKLILPLGISFFTFECMSYLLDIYRGEKELVPLRRFLLFPAFWPHMVAGPILRIREFSQQLDPLRTASTAQVVCGAERLLAGLVQKVVLADSLGTFVDLGFAGGALNNSALDNWALALAFALQIYFDFSSYSDMAIGAAQMVGIKLPENFDLPYHSTSPSEFWNRWHMTLSRWIRDYLFFPLNLKAGRRIWLRYVYLVLVMTLVGLWHGAGFGFVLWGTWHGLLLVGHRLLEKPLRRLPTKLTPALKLGGLGVTFALVTAGWVLFRAPTLQQAVRMLVSMATLRGLRPSYGVNDYLFVAFALAVYFTVIPALRRRITRDPNTVDFTVRSFWLRPLCYALAIELLFMFDRSNTAFIYFQF